MVEHVDVPTVFNLRWLRSLNSPDYNAGPIPILPGFRHLSNHDPVKLQPVTIPKPWGQEIWFSAIEARGESQVLLDGEPTPLSRYLKHYPEATDGAELLLLKILDPSAEPVLGELYFEVHEEKEEIYVVTHIDRTAWPDGVGEIRFGMNQDTRSSAGDDDTFRAQFRDAVAAYEDIRRRIDSGENGLHHAEQDRRAAMEALTQRMPLSEGDVIHVPCWTPHALRHGVRVVEFQTPTYERYIISSTQQVLTQKHWDTELAVRNMHLDIPHPPPPEAVAQNITRIARCGTFNVWRAQRPNNLRLPAVPYVIVMALGATEVGTLKLTNEECCLIPSGAVEQTTITSDGTVLLAAPGL